MPTRTIRNRPLVYFKDSRGFRILQSVRLEKPIHLGRSGGKNASVGNRHFIPATVAKLARSGEESVAGVIEGRIDLVF
jgi:hypothetical protein